MSSVWQLTIKYNFPFHALFFDASGEEKKPGARSDITQLTDMVRAGCSMKEVMESNPTLFAKTHKGLEAIAKLTWTTPILEEREVHVIWGDAGAGKTHRVHHLARAHFGDDYISHLFTGSMIADGWFETYEDQQWALFDDFNGQVPLAKLLTYLHDIAIIVPIKGGSRPWKVSRIYITSNYHPREWYKNTNVGKASIDALMRRFTTITHVVDASADLMKARMPKEYIVTNRGAGDWTDPVEQPPPTIDEALNGYAPGYIPRSTQSSS